MNNSTFKEQQKYPNWKHQIMESSGQNLIDEILKLTRNDIIDWLQWNDPNGIYTDELSLQEFGAVMLREEGIGIMTRQILGK